MVPDPYDLPLSCEMPDLTEYNGFTADTGHVSPGETAHTGSAEVSFGSSFDADYHRDQLESDQGWVERMC